MLLGSLATIKVKLRVNVSEREKRKRYPYHLLVTERCFQPVKAPTAFGKEHRLYCQLVVMNCAVVWKGDGHFRQRINALGVLPLLFGTADAVWKGYLPLLGLPELERLPGVFGKESLLSQRVTSGFGKERVYDLVLR